MEQIRQIAVVGAGLMGHGIAMDFALAGYKVNLQDVDEQKILQATGRIKAGLQMLAGAGFIPPDSVEAAGARVHPGTALNAAVSDADVVIESVFEDLELKQRIFCELDRRCSPHTILASNTSSFPPTRLAAGTERPDRVIVAHYFNPPYLLPLVEVVKGEATSDETVSTLFSLLKKAGKKPVLVKKEAPGFIANRLQAALLREAVSIVGKGIADPQDIDTVIQHGFGRRLAVAGIFEVFDIAGLDLLLAVASHLLPDLESSDQVPSLLKEKVARGEIGVRSGKGFYEWTAESAASRSRAIAQSLIHIAQLPKDG